MSEVILVFVPCIHPANHGHPKVMFMVMNDRISSHLFRVNQPSHYWDKIISNVAFDISRQVSLVWSNVKFQ